MAHQHNATDDLATAGTKPQERRRGPRRFGKDFPVAVLFTWVLGDRSGGGRGLIRDMSQGGFCVVTAEPPPRGARLLVELESDPSGPHVAACVMSVRRARLFARVPMLVGLRFDEPCPSDFFTAALGRDQRV